MAVTPEDTSLLAAIAPCVGSQASSAVTVVDLLAEYATSRVRLGDRELDGVLHVPARHWPPAR